MSVSIPGPGLCPCCWGVLTCQDGKVAPTVHISTGTHSSSTVTNPLHPNNAPFWGLPTSHTSIHCSSGSLEIHRRAYILLYTAQLALLAVTAGDTGDRSQHRMDFMKQHILGMVYYRIEFRSRDMPPKHTAHYEKAGLSPRGCCPLLPQQILASCDWEVWFPKCQICYAGNIA